MRMRVTAVAAVALSVLAATAQTKVYVAKYKDGKAAAVSYTFDDGLLDQYTELFPQLEKYGIKATFAVNGNTINRNEAQLASGGKGTDSLVIKKPRMTWAMLKEMGEHGHEITSHGWAHTNIKKIEGEALRYEVQHNDTVIWQKTGFFPRTYFYPGNVKNKAKIAFASRDRVGTRTYQTRIGSKRDVEWLGKWIRDSIATGGWAVGMTHGISRGYDHFADPQVLYDHFADIQTLRDSLWVATFHDVAAYVTERDSVNLNVSQSGGIIIVKPELKLDSRVFNYSLTLVVEAVVVAAEQDGKAVEVAAGGGKTLVTFNPHGGKITIRLRED